MATNFLKRGEFVTVTAPAEVASGAGVLVGSLFGVAQTSAANGAEVEIHIRGGYTLPKVEAQAWTLGAQIYWDGTNGVATTATSGNKLIGVAMAVAANPSTTGDVLLTGAFTQ